jgi:RNA polymerase-interacting CarD/CdnL/TRCF family regulator
MFQVGDAVVHPVRGAGVVTDIEEFRRRGRDRSYYRIELTSHPRTSVMVPVNDAEEHGVREAIPASKMKRVWRVLARVPQSLPDDFTVRRAALKDKLGSGEARQVAEALRDMAWRRSREGGLTTTERRLYRKGMNILAGEIAAVRGSDLEAVKLKVGNRISKNLTQYRVSDVN